MERYNPFAADSASSLADKSDPFASNSVRRQLSSSSNSSAKQKKEVSIDEQRQTSPVSRYSTSFPDPFGEEPSPALPPPPPPLKLSSIDSPPLSSRPPTRQTTFGTTNSNARLPLSSSAQGNRSNSVTFLHRIMDDDDDDPDTGRPSGFSSTQTHHRYQSHRDSSRGQGPSFGSFLSRATSVTSSSVSDRVTGAVGSVRSAVDSISTQIQSAVPSNLSSTASTFIAGGPNLSSSPATSALSATVGQQASSLDNFQRQQSAASYLASKLSSATNQFVGVSNQAGSGGPMPTICRQRVVMILDEGSSADWAAQFQQYRRLVSGTTPGSASSGSSAMAFTSFFSSQFSSPTSQDGGADLIEQVDFADVSVLANQTSSTCSVYVSGLSATSGASTGPSTGTTNRLSILSSASSTPAALANMSSRIIRPEYVVVRQQGKDKLEHLRNVVKALHYCMVPMFEPYDVWNIFQDRQLIFSKLLSVQKRLGRENFPLIPQIYCQTHQDLFNYIQNSKITLPYLVRTGPLGKGKIKIDSLQMLRDFATIMATSQQSCTIEQYLDVKCDLVVQKLGTSLKLFKANAGSKVAGSASREQLQQQSSCEASAKSPFGTSRLITMQQSQQEMPSSPDPTTKQAATRQTSLGSGMLSSLSSGLQQVTSSVGVATGRRISNPLTMTCAYEKLSEVNTRYREWVEAIAREFDHKMDAFSLKIVVATDDREYIVGLRNCSMEFLGNQENQDEDKRSFVELIISKMNVALPKQQPANREPSSSSMATTTSGATGVQQQQQLLSQAASQYLRRTSSDDQAKSQQQQPQQLVAQKSAGSLGDRKSITFMSETNVGGGAQYASTGQQRLASSNQLNNRGRSVSMNQSDLMSSPLGDSRQTGTPNDQQSELRRSAFYARRSSDRTDSQTTTEDDPIGLDGTQGSSASGESNLFGQRQFSLGQSIFEQTSSAFGSLQKQSMSFLKRLDSRTGADLIGVGTPPMSAKSDTAFDRNFSTDSRKRGVEPATASDPASQKGSANGSARTGIKSQSVDSASSTFNAPKSSGRQAPPKPPPPPLESIMNRQSSLANYSSHNRNSYESGGPATPTQTPRQNSSAGSGSTSSIMSSPFAGSGFSQQRSQQRVVRQNSALSAFEPFDPDLRAELAGGNQQVEVNAERAADPTQRPTSGSDHPQRLQESGATIGSPKRPSGPYDTASMTSGNSDETTTAEDTMNNLKKTFASIFGDKCE